MLKGVVVVESPAKAKTLGAYLGRDYKVIASYGHIRDLPSKNDAVDIGNHYKVSWALNDRGKKHIQELSGFLKSADSLFLATDPDREGEAISWHILDVLTGKKLLMNKNVKRVVFHEITKSAVKHAFDTPKDLDQDLVGAYLARRILDYLVGFSLSPILWRKMPGARSAGRVQSVALRLIVERELEIQKFEAEEYWSIHADFKCKDGPFTANLVAIDGRKLEKLDIKNEAEAKRLKELLEPLQYHVEKIEKKSVKRNPYAPFTTSTMQQEAVRKLGFSAKKTMTTAQKLYEGISIDGAMHGLITYMRTDSTTLSTDAISGARSFIKQELGDRYLPSSPRIYKTKAKNAQEAHEAIRPTSFDRTPESIKKYVSGDELRLYELIWKRALASQMESAVINQVSADIIPTTDDNARFRATGSSVEFDGFLSVYNDTADDDQKKLPNLVDGEVLDLTQITCDQHFTQPPARFNEASLVKKLEDLGIGRPSTYASIINILQERRYVTLQKRTFIPESIGFLVVSFLRNFFSKYVQYEFTANLEEELDDISNGKLLWENVIDNFWQEFNNHIDKAQTLTITEVINIVEKDINDYVFKGLDGDRTCPICNKGKVNLKLGRFGAFLGCTNYPECKFTQKLGSGADGQVQKEIEQPREIMKDPNNGNDPVSLKRGPYGYYFEWAKTKEKSGKKPKRLGVPKFITDPTELTPEDVITLDQLPKTIGKHPRSGESIQLVLGRFGPFLKIGKESFKLEKDISFLRITPEHALEIVG